MLSIFNFSSSTGFIALSTAAATALGCQSIISNGTNWPPFNINLTWGLDSKCQSTISDLTLDPPIRSLFGMCI